MRPDVLATVILAAVSSSAGAASAQDAGELFRTDCAACHREDGAGTPNLAPPISSSVVRAAIAGGHREYVPLVIIGGLAGRTVVDGRTFMSAMPPQPGYPDADIAALANYVYFDLNGAAPESFAPVTPEDIARIRAGAASGAGTCGCGSRPEHGRSCRAQGGAGAGDRRGRCAARRAARACRGAVASAQRNYALYCLGCHTYEGVSPELGRIPPLRDTVGHFSRVPEGRRYIVNVPGVVNTALGPAETAALLNWVIETYGGGSIPADFKPFDEAEVRALRSNPPDDVLRLRDEVMALLQAHGYDLGKDP